MLMNIFTVCVISFMIQLTNGVLKNHGFNNEELSTPRRLKRQTNNRNEWRRIQSVNNYGNHEQMGVYNRQLNPEALQTNSDHQSSGNVGHQNNQHSGLASHDKTQVYSANNNYANSRLKKNYKALTGRLTSDNNIMSRDNSYVASRNAVVEKTAQDTPKLNSTARINHWNWMQPESHIASKQTNTQSEQISPTYKDPVAFPSFGVVHTSANVNPVKKGSRLNNVNSVKAANHATLNKENITYSKNNSLLRQPINKQFANRQSYQKIATRQSNSNARQHQFNFHHRSGPNRIPTTYSSAIIHKNSNPWSKMNGSPNTPPSYLQESENNNGPWYPRKHANTIFGNSNFNALGRKVRNQIYNKNNRPNFTHRNFISANNANITPDSKKSKFLDRVPLSQNQAMGRKLAENTNMYPQMTYSTTVHYPHADFNPPNTGFSKIQGSKNIPLSSNFGFHHIRSDRMPSKTRNIVDSRSSLANSYKRQHHNRISYPTTGSAPFSIQNSASQPRSNFDNIRGKVYYNTNRQTMQKTPGNLLQSGPLYPETTSPSEMKIANIYPGPKSITSRGEIDSMARDISLMSGIKHLKVSTDLDLREYEDKHKNYVTGYGVSEISGTDMDGEWYGLLQSIGYYKTSTKPVRSIGVEPNPWQLHSAKPTSYVPRVWNQETPVVSKYQKLAIPTSPISQQNRNYITPLSSRSYSRPGFYQRYRLDTDRLAPSTYSANRGRLLNGGVISPRSYSHYNGDNKNILHERFTYPHRPQDRKMNELNGGNFKSLFREPRIGYIGSYQNQQEEPLSAGLLDLYYSLNGSFNAFFLSMSKSFNQALRTLFFN